MKNNNVSKLIIAIIAVILIIAIVGGSTFAYFQWTTAANQRTAVNITIEQGRITMHIEPERTVFEELKPTANCDAYDNGTNTHPYATMYGDALVTVVNNTGTLAIPSFKLSAKVTKGGTGTLTSSALSHIHYAVAAIATTEDADGNAVKGTTVTGSCSSPLTAEANGDKTFFSNSNLIATGTFESVSTAGAWSDLPSTTGTYLPRQYNTNTNTSSGVTFKALQYDTTHQYFRVYIWLDSTYTTTTVGNTVSDPLQDAKIEITWSTNSMIEQVSY